jgi:hypothetical protein
VAPALHSLIIRERQDVADIMEFLLDNHVDLTKLILKNCKLGDNVSGIFTKIVTLYPELKALSLERCYPLHTDVYSLIPHLKKLSELKLSLSQVHYVYVKRLQTHFCICEHM